ncbi:MAG TPA: aminotransferase, partial [Alcanivorax sp.]|nr:aminotransferase [Alcanivorax sp.]
QALQEELGGRVRALFTRYGIQSVAASGFQAPGVVVCYTGDDGMHNAKKFIGEGLQTAAGVPLMCDEPDDFKTFRVGLFGLDKLNNIERTVENLEQALAKILD